MVGQRTALVSARGAGDADATTDPVSAPGAAGAIELTPGTYTLGLWFDLPRAQLVDWTVTCPGVTRTGQSGETFESYRTRRLAQLRADREREARMVNGIVGAVAPRATVVAADGSRVDAQASVQVQAQVVEELPPGDVGRTRAVAEVQVVTEAPGACVLTALADDPDVAGGFRVSRIRDLDAEAREARAIAQQRGIEVRGSFSTHLVALGADPDARAKREAAEAMLRAEREAKREAERQAQLDAEAKLYEERQAKLEVARRAQLEIDLKLRAEREVKEREARLVREERERAERVQVEARLQIEREARLKIEMEARLKLQIRIELEARITAQATALRGAYLTYLVGMGGDLHARERRIRERREAELRVAMQVEYETRVRAQGQLEAERKLRMELELRARLAASARVSMSDYLVSLGARKRPPMPAIIVEQPGSRPFDGAVWIAGKWSWSGVEWTWTAGAWMDETVMGNGGGGQVVVGTRRDPAPVVVRQPPAVVVQPPAVVVQPPTVVVQPPQPPTVVIPTGVSVDLGGIGVNVNVGGGARPAPRPRPPVVTQPPRPTQGPTVRDHRRK